MWWLMVMIWFFFDASFMFLSGRMRSWQVNFQALWVKHPRLSLTCALHAEFVANWCVRCGYFKTAIHLYVLVDSSCYEQLCTCSSTRVLMWWLMGDSSFFIHHSSLPSVRSKCQMSRVNHPRHRLSMPSTSDDFVKWPPPPPKQQALTSLSFILNSQRILVTHPSHNTSHYINICVCPSLKKFTCDHKNWCEDLFARQVSNGVKPVIPFLLEDIRMGSVEVEVGFCPFIGMSVPGTCIAEILSKERVSCTGW